MAGYIPIAGRIHKQKLEIQNPKLKNIENKNPYYSETAPTIVNQKKLEKKPYKGKTEQKITRYIKDSKVKASNSRDIGYQSPLINKSNRPKKFDTSPRNYGRTDTVGKFAFGLHDDEKMQGVGLSDYTYKPIAVGYLMQRLNEELGKNRLAGNTELSDEAKRYSNKIDEIQYNSFENKNAPFGGWLNKGLQGAMELTGQRVADLTDEDTLIYGATGAGAGAMTGSVAGLAGSAVGAGSGLVAGISAGVGKNMFEAVFGSTYEGLREAGVSDETAYKTALASATGQSIIEVAQIDELAKAIKVLKNSGKKELAGGIEKMLLDYGKSVVSQTGEEVAQEVVAMTGETIAKKVEGLPTDTMEQHIQRAGETALSSALAFGLMLAPSGTLSGIRINNYQREQKNKQMEQINATIAKIKKDNFKNINNGKDENIYKPKEIKVNPELKNASENVNQFKDTDTFKKWAENVARKANIDIEFIIDKDSAYDGYFHKYTQDEAHDDRKGKVYVNLNSSAPLKSVFIHEFTHSLENNEKEYWDYGNFVINNLLEPHYGTRDIVALAELKQSYYAQKGIELDIDEAKEEIIADITGKFIFSDEKQIDKLYKADRNIFYRVYKALTDFVKRFGADNTTKEIIKAQKLFAKILKANRENIQNDKDISNAKPKYLFAGENALKADKKALEEAKQMEQSGADSKEIFNKTGWFKGIDNKWRFEIDDSQSAYRDIESDNVDNQTLDSVLSHEKLYKNYPEVKNIKFAKDIENYFIDGMYSPENNKISLNKDLENVDKKSTLLHEIQHSIQNAEEFDTIKGAEIEANLVEKRIDLTAKKRREKLPETARKLPETARKLPETARKVQDKFSLKEPVEETKNLIAIHNISDYKLAQLLELDTIVAPSIAITKDFDNFGDITFVFDKSTIDPKNKNNHVIGADGYTPRFPQVIEVYPSEAIKKFNDDLGIDSIARIANIGAYTDININSSDYTIFPKFLLYRDSIVELLIKDLKEKSSNIDKEELNIKIKELKKKNIFEIISNFKKSKKRFVMIDNDPFYPSGNRKPFSKRFKELTPELALKVMKKDGVIGTENSWFSLGRLKALVSPRYKSMKQIKDNRKNIVSSEEEKVSKSYIDYLYREISDKLEWLYSLGTFTLEDVFLEMAEIINGNIDNLTFERFEKIMSQYTEKGQEVGIADFKKVITFFEELRDSPTDYFEAKPMRLVDYSEIKAVLVPALTNRKLVQELENKGLNVYKYKNKEDRLKILNSEELKKLKFSVKGSEEYIREQLSMNLDYKGKQQELDIATKALTELSNPKEVPQGVELSEFKIIGKGYTEKFINNGSVSLVDKKFNNVNDLAMLAQIYRNPKFETFRYIFTRELEDRTEEVVFTTGVTARLPAITRVIPSEYSKEEFLYNLVTGSKKLGATKVYFLHNHPSGYPVASNEDKQVTIDLGVLLEEKFDLDFGGHIIINSNQYSVLKYSKYEDRDDKSYSISETLYKMLGYEDKLLTPEIPHALIGKEFRSDKDVAELSKVLQMSDKVSTLFFATTKHDIRSILEVDNEAYKDTYFLKKLRQIAIELGASKIVLVTRDNGFHEFASRSIQDGYFLDSVLLLDSENHIGANVDSDERLRGSKFYMGRNVHVSEAIEVEEKELTSYLVHSVARNVKELFNSHLPYKDLEKELKEFYEIPPENMQQLDEKAEIIAKKIASRIPTQSELDSHFKLFKDRIRTTLIKTDDNFKKDIPDYTAWRRKNISLRFGNDGIPIDTLYKTLVEEFPEFTDKEIINPINQLLFIADQIKQDKNHVIVDDVDEETRLFDIKLKLFDDLFKYNTGELMSSEFEQAEKDPQIIPDIEDFEPSIIPDIKTRKDPQIIPDDEELEPNVIPDINIQKEPRTIEQVRNKEKIEVVPDEEPQIDKKRPTKAKSERGYKAFPEGEEPRARTIEIEQENEHGKTSRFTRTTAESNAINDEQAESLKKLVEEGRFTYNPIPDKEALKNGQERLKTLSKEGALEYLDHLLSSRKLLDKNDIALGELLIQTFAKENDYERLERAVAIIAIAGTRAGQSVQAMRLLKRLSPEGQLIGVTKIVNTLNAEQERKHGKAKHKEIKLSNERKKDILASKNPRKTAQAVERAKTEIYEQVAPDFLDKWNAWRYLSMLGNLKTHIRNIIGNTIFVPAKELKNIIGAGIEKTVIRGGRERTKSVGFVPKIYKAFALKDFEENLEIIEGGGKENVIKKQKIFNQNVSKLFKPLMPVFNTMEHWRVFNSTLLEKEDLFFLKRAYIGALTSYLKANKIKPSLIYSYMMGEELSEENADKLEQILNDSRAYAILEAQKSTYRDYSQMANALNYLKKQNLATQILIEGAMPFTKTPINIIKRGVEYSPVGILKGLKELIYDRMKIGKELEGSTPEEIEFMKHQKVLKGIDSLASGLSGSSLLLLGMFLASIGVVSGEGEDNKKLRDFDNMQGSQNYSINTPHGSYTIDWLTPVSMPFFVGVEIYNSLENDGYSNFVNIVDSFTAIPEPIINTSMLQGLNRVITSYEQDKALTNLGINLVTGYLSQGVPTIAGQLARTIDDTRRKTYIDKTVDVPDIFQRVIQTTMMKTPMASQKLIPYRDSFGNAQVEENIYKRAFSNFISPSYRKEKNDDVVLKELRSLYELTGDTAVLPSLPSKEYGGRDLSAEEFDEMSRIKGSTAYEVVENLIFEKEFYQAENSDKVLMMKRAYDYATGIAKNQALNEPLDGWIKRVEDSKKLGVEPEKYILYSKYRESLEGKEIEGGLSAKVREKIFYDDSIKTEYKNAFDNILLDSNKVVDYSSKERLKLSQVSERADRKWVVAKKFFSLDDYLKYYPIISSSEYKKAQVLQNAVNAGMTPQEAYTLWNIVRTKRYGV